MQTWLKKRNGALTAADGYLSLVGLAWLKDGENRLGSNADNDCLFPDGAPGKIGVLTVADGELLFSAEPGVSITCAGLPVTQLSLKSDCDPGGPTILSLGTLSWFVIKRGAVLGIRMRDSNSQTLQNFSAVDRFPLDESWVITGTFIPHEKAQMVQIPTILGTPADMLSPGVIDLEIDGKRFQLLALQGKQPEQFFLIIADETTGKESYGGGRFLMTEALQADGKVVVDFNKATNPPCAFTPYATCPRPPEQNRIDVAVTAGEKQYVYEI